MGLKCSISLITGRAVPALSGCLFQQEGGNSYSSVLSNTALGVQTLCKILLVEEVSKDCTPVTACVWENTGQGEKKSKTQIWNWHFFTHRLTTPLRTLSLWNIQHGSWFKLQTACFLFSQESIAYWKEIRKEKPKRCCLAESQAVCTICQIYREISHSNKLQQKQTTGKQTAYSGKYQWHHLPRRRMLWFYSPCRERAAASLEHLVVACLPHPGHHINEQPAGRAQRIMHRTAPERNI